MEDFKFDMNISFDNVFVSEIAYHDAVDGIINISDHIRIIFRNTNRNNAELCYRLNELKEEYGTLHKVNGHFIEFYEYCERAFGFSKRTVCNYIQVFNKFICAAGGTARFKSEFEDFNISKLCELLVVSDAQLIRDLKNKNLSASMSKQQIREYVKKLKGGTNAENKVLEEQQSLDEQEAELPSAFDPQHEYDFEFYKSKTKGDLIGYCIDLQRTVQKLLRKKKN